jgi:exopolyphosphatase/guanosine-5'-triphosphate,3'-diphosphate pyrophosphatase
MAVSRFAAINIGSYELVMKLYEITSGKKLKVIDHIRYVMELGRETYKDQRLTFETIEKMCDILVDFQKILEEYQITDYEAVATSGIREADNAQIILDRIRVRTGMNVKLTSNSEQRLLTYKALEMYPEKFEEFTRGNTAILDVGAGSIQISLLDKKNIASTQNIKIGSLRIRELLYNLSDNLHHFDTLLDELINNELETFKRMFIKDKQIDTIIATGEQITLFTKNTNTGAFDQLMSVDDYVEKYKILNAKSPEDVAKELQVSSEQATILIPCARIYGRFIEVAGAKNLWMPGTDICDGMAVDFGLRRKKLSTKHDFDEDILNEVRGMAKRYKSNLSHIQATSSLATDIFDVIKKVHGMGRRERLLLELSALLHDCGKYISIQSAADCSYNIIMATEIIGLSHKEREMIAKIVRYNTTPVEQEEDLSVIKLTAILRVANALDRSHKQKFKDCRIELKEDELIIHTKTKEDITLEKGLFGEKAEFFKEVYGIKVTIKQKKFSV